MVMDSGNDPQGRQYGCSAGVGLGGGTRRGVVIFHGCVRTRKWHHFARKWESIRWTWLKHQEWPQIPDNMSPKMDLWMFCVSRERLGKRTRGAGSVTPVLMSPLVTPNHPHFHPTGARKWPRTIKLPLLVHCYPNLHLNDMISDTIIRTSNFIGYFWYNSHKIKYW